MSKWASYLGQVIIFGLFIVVIAYFSTAPAYRHLQADKAVIKLSLSHAGQIKGKCRQRSEQEMSDLAPNMRMALDCPRERSPVTIDMQLNGRPFYHSVSPPSGFNRDGISSEYQKFVVPIGQHLIKVRLKDSESDEYQFSKESVVQLKPAQVFVINFKAQAGGFIFD